MLATIDKTHMVEKMITDFEHQNNILRWSCNHEIVQIEAWGQNSLRVRATQAGEIRNDLVSALLETPLTQPQIKIGIKFSTIRNGAITAEISVEGHLRFIDSSSKTELLAEVIPHFSNLGFRTFKVMQGNDYRVEAHFQSYAGERLFGLGQHTHGQLDQKGCVVDLIQHNGEVSIPFLLSNRGYGFLWNNPAVGRVELGVNGTTLEIQSYRLA